jgi:hypothetical protein
MKIKRKSKKYAPLTIKFDTNKEESLFLSIIDSIDSNHVSNTSYKLSEDEYKLIIEISNWFTNNLGYRGHE